MGVGRGVPRTALAMSLLVLAALALPNGSSSTAAGPAYTFAAVGDIGANAATSGAVLSSVAGGDASSLFVLGDLSYGGPGSEDAWCDFVKARVPTAFPVEIVAGNHESDGTDGHVNNFTACLPNQLPGVVGTFGRQYYVDVPSGSPLVRMVMVSPALTFPEGTWQYPAGSARYEWVAAAIDGARAAGVPWVVVGMHKPCLTLAARGCGIGADLMNLLVAKKVDLVLAGHEHHYSRTAQLRIRAGCTAVVPDAFNPACVYDADADLVGGGGTVFVTAGTGGTGQVDPLLSDAEAGYFVASGGSASAPSYGFVRVRADVDALAVSFVHAAGAAFTDAFTVTKTVGPPDPNQPPVAAFTVATSPLRATFDAAGSLDPDGVVTQYAWDFGDGQTGSGVAPTHTYLAGGDYPVRLTVTDDGGATAELTQTVTVAPATVGTEVATDTFERVVANGWGSADVGGAWTPNTTSPGVFSVGGGLGVLNLRTAGAGPWAYLGGATGRDVSARLQVSYDKVPAGSGTRVESAVLMRRTTAGQ